MKKCGISMPQYRVKYIIILKFQELHLKLTLQDPSPVTFAMRQKRQRYFPLRTRKLKWLSTAFGDLCQIKEKHDKFRRH